MGKKKKILLLSDDLRMSSGIATMSKAFVLGTVHQYDWFQVGAAINHPEQGKLLDVSEDVRKQTGVADANVRILPWNGYGNPDLIRQILNTEQPDAILHFTDPRYWTWLYEMEHEIRQNVPLLFYAIWDDVGNPPDFELDPLYNREFYESCDWIGCISKQTYGMIKRLTSLDTEVTWGQHADWQVKYVPHGIDENDYKPIDVPDEFKKTIIGDRKYDFIFFWSNRNLRRKQPSDIIYAYKTFCKAIGKEKAEKTCLLMHTQPIDENGTNLYEVAKRIKPYGDIIFSENRQSVENLNYLYNMADCTINIAGNEGFGLTTAESVMAGTPIIVNVTGGLQDQCGFKLNGEYLTAEDYVKIGTLHDWREWESRVTWGEWVIPIWSRARTIAGSLPTPYIWDDKIDVQNLADAMLEMYNIPKDERKQRGLIGRNAFINEMGLSEKNMCDQMIEGIETAIQNWKPRKRYELYTL